MLAVFHLRELVVSGREVLIRANSQSDAFDLAAKTLGVATPELRDAKRFGMVEVNYGDDFCNAGPRGVIAVF